MKIRSFPRPKGIARRLRPPLRRLRPPLRRLRPPLVVVSASLVVVSASFLVVSASGKEADRPPKEPEDKSTVLVMLKLMEGMQALQNKCWMEGMTKELQKLFAMPQHFQLLQNGLRRQGLSTSTTGWHSLSQ